MESSEFVGRLEAHLPRYQATASQARFMSAHREAFNKYSHQHYWEILLSFKTLTTELRSAVLERNMGLINYGFNTNYMMLWLSYHEQVRSDASRSRMVENIHRSCRNICTYLNHVLFPSPKTDTLNLRIDIGMANR